VAIVCAVAVLREGSEIVLFQYGVAVGGGEGLTAIGVGSAGGLILGATAGVLIYRGLIAIPTRYLFAVTTWLIALLSAGMAAQAVRFLAQANVLTALGETVWDSSWLLSEAGLVGKVLHTLIGYTDQPTVMQLLAYIAVLIVTFALMRLFGSRQPAPAEPPLRLRRYPADSSHSV
jgi:high-affinity iron transporter